MVDEFVLFRRLAGARIRSNWQYRASFVLQTLQQAIVGLLDLVVIWGIFQRVPRLGAWSLEQMVCLYGFSLFGLGVADLFVGSVETCDERIRTGTFDQVLLRPVSPLLLISAEEFVLRRVGRAAQSAIVLAFALAAAVPAWTPARAWLVASTAASSVVIFSAAFVATNAISFWLPGSREVASSFTYGGAYASQYPLPVYATWVRHLLRYVLPLGFAAYIPCLVLLDAPNPLGIPSWAAYLSPVAAAAFALVAAAVWRLAIRHYTSTGS